MTIAERRRSLGPRGEGINIPIFMKQKLRIVRINIDVIYQMCWPGHKRTRTLRHDSASEMEFVFRQLASGELNVKWKMMWKITFAQQKISSSFLLQELGNEEKIKGLSMKTKNQNLTIIYILLCYLHSSLLVTL